MRRILCWFCLSCPPLFALGPDSIAGKIYRDAVFARVGPSTTVTERTIAFGEDGRFSFIKYGTGSAMIFAAANKVFIQSPPSDGSYVYRRTGEAAAVIELAHDNGERSSLQLEFASASAGPPASDVTATTTYSFSFTEARALELAPAANISLRGRVAGDRPLIAGFVVPGVPKTNSDRFPPPFDAAQREVLIRVVGPSLAPFGISNGWADPDFQLFRGAEPAVLHQFSYGDWTSALNTPSLSPTVGLRRIFDFTGAFALLAGSKDAVAVVRLAPGAYTIVAAATGSDPGGEALIEVYFLP